MISLRRTVALPVAAAALVSAVLGVQFAHGGGDYVPTTSAPPCVHRTVTSVSDGLDGLGEQLVLLGLDGAACRLHQSREALTLELARSQSPTDRQLRALRAGLLAAVTRLKDAGALPKVSSFTDEALDNADLNFLLKAAIRALPDSVIDAALHTDDVLDRTIENLDLRSVFANLDDPGELRGQINSAVTDAVKDALLDRLRNLI